jgi:exonuclease SbcC
VNPLRLRCSNYRTFADLELGFPDGCSAIVGENGAGKSSIVNAVELSLFGGRLADHLSDTGAEELMVELTFEHRGELYRVRRGYSGKGRGKTTVDFEQWAEEHLADAPGSWEPCTLETAKATQALIEETLGFTRDTWRASSFLAQGDGAAFCDADPRDRKRILAEAVLGRDPIWPRLLQAVRSDRIDAQTKAAELAGALERADVDLARLPEVERDVHTLTEAAAGAQEEHDRAEHALADVAERYRVAEGEIAARRTAEAKFAEAGARLTAFAQVEQDAAAADGELPSLAARVTELEVLVARGIEIQQANHKLVAQREVWAKRVAARETLLERADRVEREITTLRVDASALLAKAAETATKISALREAPGSECDRCGTPLLDEARERALASYTAEETELCSQAAMRTTQADGLPDPEKIRAEAGDPPTEPPDTTETPPDVQAAPAELGAARERKAALQARVAAAQEPGFLRQLGEARAALAAAEQALAALPQTDPGAVTQIQADGLRARADLAAARAALDEQTALKTRAQAECDRLQRLAEQTKSDHAARDGLLGDVDQLAVLERAYSANGIPALLIENAAIPSIEAEANRILTELGGVATHVELRTQRELKSGDGLAEALDVVVYTLNGARDYATLSGGERSRVNVALRIALARLLASRRGAGSELLVLDEPESLDEEGQARLAEVLRGLEGEFAKVILVSHVPGLRDVFESVIEVEKVDGVSRVVGSEVEAVVA